MDVVHFNQKQLATRWNMSKASLERCEEPRPTQTVACGGLRLREVVPPQDKKKQIRSK